MANNGWEHYHDTEGCGGTWEHVDCWQSGYDPLLFIESFQCGRCGYWKEICWNCVTEETIYWYVETELGVKVRSDV